MTVEELIKALQAFEPGLDVEIHDLYGFTVGNATGVSAVEYDDGKPYTVIVIETDGD